MHMCPYARFQSVMFDKDTLTISYDSARGEHRGPRKREVTPADVGLGDCIDCQLCVQVCPTGIDIRDGLQMECIGCAACIDACDSIMDKMGYARGLVSYTSEHQLQGGKTHLLRPRLIGYSAVLLVMIAALVVALVERPMVSLDVTKDRGMFRENAQGQDRKTSTASRSSTRHSSARNTGWSCWMQRASNCKARPRSAWHRGKSSMCRCRWRCCPTGRRAARRHCASRFRMWTSRGSTAPPTVALWHRSTAETSLSKMMQIKCGRGCTHITYLFKANMKRYEKFADDIAELIRSGVLGPGQRVPSVRYASQTYGVSPSTVFQAYYLLERRGLIRARPRSGYFVNTHAPSPVLRAGGERAGA